LASEPGGGANYSTYDASGNVIEATTPRGFVIAMQYDALNRLTRRVTPSVSEGNALCYWYGTLCTYTFPILDDASTRCIGVDTALYAYDASGQTRVADNNWARIRRSYAPNGALLSETQIIRKYATEAPNACGGGDRHAGAFSETGSDWNAHSYQLQFGYDHLGRRISLTLPTQLDPCSGACVQQYAYSSRGELATLTHPSASGGTLQTTYTYDATGQLTSTTAPGSVVLNLAYDREGRVLRRVGSGGHPAADTLRYDAGGRVIRVSSGGTPVALEYAGLGALASVTGLASGLSSEAFLVDGIGTLRYTHDVDMVAGVNRTRRHTFSGLRLTGGVLADTGSNCATSLVRSCHPSWYIWSLALEHDASGNVTSTAERDTRGTNLSDASTVLRNARSYFGADERLMSHEDAEGVNGVAGTSSEYRYDALGRRVLVRVRKIEPTCSSPCDAYIERTVYDGDQVLAEIRSSGQANATAAVLEGEGIAAQDGATSGWTDPTYPLLFGVVLYAHGLGVDAPAHLAKLRPDSGWTTLTPQAGWRGDIAFGNLADGTNCTTFTPGRCPTEWLAASVSAYRRDVGADPVLFSNWFGSLVRGRRDASGLTFLRNRYYNPTTGQFTQLDPIGLAGGLNAYGFAGGDPVNYSDPFGLCKKGMSKESAAESCRRATAQEGRTVADAAVNSGEWRYSQGSQCPNNPPKNPANRVGDCTDYTHQAARSINPDVPYFNTTAILAGDASQWYAAVGANEAQPGDIYIRAGHAGVVTNVDRTAGKVRVHQNGGSASPYEDRPTQNWTNNLNSGSYFRVLVPR
jgi:RHS repeat-associated protein